MCFLRHDWAKYGEVKDQVVSDTIHKDVIFRRTYQERICLRCGKIQRREVDRVRVPLKD